MGSPNNNYIPTQTNAAQKRSTETASNLPVILVLTVPPKERDLTQEREDEMRALLDTAGCQVCAVAIQHIDKPTKATYIGKGKCQDIWDLIEDPRPARWYSTSANPLPRAQPERLLEAKVMDYSALILHIFAQNARTHQSMLAVELAQLEHNHSRLKRLWNHLDRIKAYEYARPR